MLIDPPDKEPIATGLSHYITNAVAVVQIRRQVGNFGLVFLYLSLTETFELVNLSFRGWI